MSTRPSVVTLSTYAPSPLYGGPARLYWLRQVLEQQGFDTASIVANTLPDAGQITDADLRLRPVVPDRFSHHPLYEDVMVGQRAAGQPDLVERLRNFLVQRRPHIVWLEQPWLLPLLDAAGLPPGATLVYSSQNVEYRLKMVLEGLQSGDAQLPNSALIDAVKRAESEAISRAAVVFSICEADRCVMLNEFGKDSVVLPNGSSIGNSQANPHSRFASLLSLPGIRIFGFAASSYLPNQAGLAAIADPSLAFLPPTARIALAGSLSDAVSNHPSIARHWAVNGHRLERLGFLSPADFVQFSLHVPCTIVPIFHGGGSNLKTADALASGTAVIATTNSLVGYESVVAEEPTNVTVVNGAHEFRCAMLDALRSPAQPRRPTQRAKALSWETRLQVAATTLRSM